MDNKKMIGLILWLIGFVVFVACLTLLGREYGMEAWLFGFIVGISSAVYTLGICIIEG